MRTQTGLLLRIRSRRLRPRVPRIWRIPGFASLFPSFPLLPSVKHFDCGFPRNGFAVNFPSSPRSHSRIDLRSNLIEIFKRAHATLAMNLKTQSIVFAAVAFALVFLVVGIWFIRLDHPRVPALFQPVAVKIKTVTNATTQVTPPPIP